MPTTRPTTQRGDLNPPALLLASTASAAHIMALSANMAGAGAGGAGMAMTGGMAFSGSAMATPATFRPPPSSGHGGPNDTCCGGGGGGGAYDLRALEREEEPEEDLHACLGVDVGTSSIKVRLVCRQHFSNGSIWCAVMYIGVCVCHSFTCRACRGVCASNALRFCFWVDRKCASRGPRALDVGGFCGASTEFCRASKKCRLV